MSFRAYIAAFDLVAEAAESVAPAAASIVVGAHRTRPNCYVTRVVFFDGEGAALREVAVPQKHKKLSEHFARALLQEACKHIGANAGSVRKCAEGVEWRAPEALAA